MPCRCRGLQLRRAVVSRRANVRAKDASPRPGSPVSRVSVARPPAMVAAPAIPAAGVIAATVGADVCLPPTCEGPEDADTGANYAIPIDGLAVMQRPLALGANSRLRMLRRVTETAQRVTGLNSPAGTTIHFRNGCAVVTGLESGARRTFRNRNGAHARSPRNAACIVRSPCAKRSQARQRVQNRCQSRATGSLHQMQRGGLIAAAVGTGIAAGPIVRSADQARLARPARASAERVACQCAASSFLDSAGGRR